MISKKVSRFLFEMTKNARITTKELSKSLSISQQAASYTLQTHLKDKSIQFYQTVIDPAKLGLLNVIVFFNYKTFDHATTQRIKKDLKTNPWVTRVEEVSQGADLLAEYTIPNLSFFNKQNKEFLFSHKHDLSLEQVYVVIVKHHYTKNYLHKFGPEVKEEILSGDRESLQLTVPSQEVLLLLAEDARMPLITMAKKTGLDSKTIVRLKKQLERQRIIRRYSLIFNYSAFDMIREHIFINLDYLDENEERRFLEYAKQQKNIISLTKLIGKYELLLTIERHRDEKSLINELRKQFVITDYRLMSVDFVDKYRFLPEPVFE